MRSKLFSSRGQAGLFSIHGSIRTVRPSRVTSLKVWWPSQVRRNERRTSDIVSSRDRASVPAPFSLLFRCGGAQALVHFLSNPTRALEQTVELQQGQLLGGLGGERHADMVHEGLERDISAKGMRASECPGHPGERVEQRAPLQLHERIPFGQWLLLEHPHAH